MIKCDIFILKLYRFYDIISYIKSTDTERCLTNETENLNLFNFKSFIMYYSMYACIVLMPFVCLIL